MTRSVLWSFLLQLEIVFLKRRLDDLERFRTEAVQCRSEQDSRRAEAWSGLACERNASGRR
jgi:hypothetical protein